MPCDIDDFICIRLLECDKGSHIHNRKLSNTAEMKVIANPATKYNNWWQDY